jgi:hypothetical protein
MKNYSSGNATVTIQEDMQQMFMGFLKTVAPNAEAIMDAELKRIEKEAEKDWPKRKPIIRRDSQGQIVFFRKTSLESYKKFKRGMKVDANGNFVVFLKNTAPYSYMIKYGEDSENWKSQDIIKPQGKRVADETLVKPHRKTANKVIKALANDLAKRV